MADSGNCQWSRGEVERVEGLCPRCWKPALVRFGIYTLRASGVTHVATATRCLDCNTAEVEKVRT